MDARVHKSETSLYGICNACVKAANLPRVSRDANLKINQKEKKLNKLINK